MRHLPARSRATSAAQRPMAPAPSTSTLLSGSTRPSPMPRTVTASGSVSDAVTASTSSGIGARFSSGASSELGESAVDAEPDPGARAPAQVGATGAAVDADPAGDVRRHRVAHVGQARPDRRPRHLPSRGPATCPSAARRCPCQTCRSDPQMPQASTRSRTQPSRSGPGSWSSIVEPVLGPHGTLHSGHRRRARDSAAPWAALRN